VTRLRLNSASATPVYQQIVEQVRYLIESGTLAAGERLPPTRLLAQNLGVNRNTVAKAYGLLRERGLIDSRGAAGTVVAADAAPVAAANARDAARALLTDPVRAALDLGIEPEEVGRLALNLALRAASAEITVVFAECNHERAIAFATELTQRLQVDVAPSLITELDERAADCDVLVTTFFHLAEVQRWQQGRARRLETVAIVVAPHLQTLTRVAALPATARVGVRYTTEHQAVQVRDWLAEASQAEVIVLPEGEDAAAGSPALDVLVVPQEHPELAQGAPSSTEVIEFGGVLDEGSVRMLDDLLSEVRARERRRSG
jgi:DNA-binding transcriptional regulator YhcF (GntR family)